jgi:hypothetical protein
VLVRERFDRKIRTAEDITLHLGQHLLVTLQPLAAAETGAHPLFSPSRGKARPVPSRSVQLKEAK